MKITTSDRLLGKLEKLEEMLKEVLKEIQTKLTNKENNMQTVQNLLSNGKSVTIRCENEPYRLFNYSVQNSKLHIVEINSQFSQGYRTFTIDNVTYPDSINNSVLEVSSFIELEGMDFTLKA